MINLAEPKQRKPLSITNSDIFEAYDSERMSSVQSSVLLTHLSGNFLSANGYVAFNGGDPALFQGGEFSNKADAITRVLKGISTKQGLDLSQDRDEEQIVYSNAGVNVLFFKDLTTELARLQEISEKSKKLNPKKTEREIKREKQRITTKQK